MAVNYQHPNMDHSHAPQLQLMMKIRTFVRLETVLRISLNHTVEGKVRY